MSSSSSSVGSQPPKIPVVPRKSTHITSALEFAAAAQEAEEPVEVASHTAVHEHKDGPELHALLQMSVNPPRSEPVDDEADDPPPPPRLSAAGAKIAATMTANFTKLSALQDDGEAAKKLTSHTENLLGIIQRQSEFDRWELLDQLGSCLNSLQPALKQTPQWQAAVSKVGQAEDAAGPAAQLFRRQTSRALQVYANLLDRANVFYDPKVFSGQTGQLLNILFDRIAQHKPEGERCEMLAHFATGLCAVAESSNAANHPEQRLQLVNFLATRLGPASRSFGADEPHNLQFMEALENRLAPHIDDIAMRKKIEGAIKTACDDKATRVNTCMAIARAIGASPLGTADRNAYLAQLDLRFREQVELDVRKGAPPLIVHYQYVDAFRFMRDYVSRSKDWPDPAAYQALTDAVNKINQDENAKARARGK